jgi:hypothetical protein
VEVLIMHFADCLVMWRHTAELPPIAFTDAQMREIATAALPLPPVSRAVYLERIAALLAGRDFGDGDVHRAVVQAQREALRPTAVRI